jgi:hypothetical protein
MGAKSRAEEADRGDPAVGLVVVGLLLDEEGAVRAFSLVLVSDVVAAGDLGGGDAEYVLDVTVAEPGAQHLEGTVARGSLPGAAGCERTELDLWVEQVGEPGEVAAGNRVGERRAE